jgi:tetratricopeptide (TPR) repeat protein
VPHDARVGCDAGFEESMTRNRTNSVTGLALVLGLSLAASGCGKYSLNKLVAQKAYKEGNTLYAAADWKGAAAKYETALKSDPDKVEIFFYLGNSYDNLYKVSRAGEPENDANIQKAIEFYLKAAERGPNPQIRKLALQYLVNAYGPEKLNDPAKAEPIVEKMIVVDPTDSANYIYLAKIYEESGRYEEAEKTLMKGRDAKPNDPLIYQAISAFYNRQGDFPKTMDALNKAAELDPKNPSGYQLLATYYWEKVYKDHRLSTAQKKEYLVKGIEATDKALALNPEYGDALSFKNLLLRLEGNEETDMAKRAAYYKQADELRNKAIELNKKKATGR